MVQLQEREPRHLEVTFQSNLADEKSRGGKGVVQEKVVN